MSLPDIPKYCLNLIKLFLEKQHIRARDIRCLRQKVFGYAIDTPEKADILFIIHQNIKGESEEWRHFFVDALTDYVVHQSKPRRHVSPENAVWLVERIISGGKQPDATELAAVIRVLEMARSAPNLLATLPLIQIQRAIADGHGAARSLTGNAEPEAAGIVSSADVQLIKRVLRAGQNESTLGISYEEAAVLFDIYRETEGADNAPEWNELFVNAVDNAIRFASGDIEAGRSEALDQDASTKLRDGVAGFLQRMEHAIEKGWIDSEEERIWWQEKLAPRDAKAKTSQIESPAARTATTPKPCDHTDDWHDGAGADARPIIPFVAPQSVPTDAPLMALVEDLPPAREASAVQAA